MLISGDGQVQDEDRSPTPSSPTGDKNLVIEENKFSGNDHLSMLSPQSIPNSHRVSKSDIPEMQSGKRGRSSMHKNQSSTKEKTKKTKPEDLESR